MRARGSNAGRALAALALGSSVLLFTLASCSLGLDESKITEPDADPFDASFVPDAVVPDGSDGGVPTDIGGPCTTDAECKTTNACLKPHCDLTRKACVFDVCKAQACSSATCDQATKTCGAAKTHPFRAVQFPVGAGIGCGGGIGRCFAAVYPYLFVGTTNGVVAYDASDPASATPREVVVTGLGFLPTQILASGSRVFFLGSQAGGAASARVPLAYLDVPADPFAKSLAVKTVLAAYNRPAANGVTLFPRPKDTALLVDVTTPSAAPVEPPLVEPLTLTTQAFLPTVGNGYAGVSGSRLVMTNINAGTFIASFGFINNVGAANPVNEGDKPVAAAGTVAAPQAFANGPDGALLWVVESTTGPPTVPPALPPTVRAVKAFFIVDSEAATAFNPAAGVDVEVYAPVATPAIGAALVGPAAMLDAKTAMVTAATPQNPAQTSVQFINKAPLGIVKNVDNTPRRFLLNGAVATLAAAATNGIGYVLASESPTAMSVYVFDPACGP